MTYQNAIDTIKERIDIVELIGATVQLRKAGRSLVGFCPFHQNTRTPAFTVYPDSQSFHCFGCKASGTVFDFVMRTQGIEFREALEMLAHRAGVELAPRTAQDDERDQQRDKLIEINVAAARLFQHMLRKSPRGEQARAYVAQRQIDDWAIDAFQLGYAPEERTLLFDYLTNKQGYDASDVVAAGLAIQRDDGSHYDRFRGRVIFPIRNSKGELIAFGGRAMGDAQPKYLNSPQTLLFDKSSVLYGLDMARDAIRQHDAIVIVEGYVDVIALHQHGYRNVVAPLGTALTAEHVQMLKKRTKNIYLALDADSAGIRATLKGLQTLHDNLDAQLVPVPTPQGVIAWSRSVDAQIRIIALPDGQDPDELLHADAEAWPRLIDQAMPAMDFYVQMLTRDLDLDALPDKRTALERLGPVIMQLGNQLEQSHYIQLLARMLNLDESVLRGELRRQQPPTVTKRTPVAPPPPVAAAPTQPAQSSAASPLLRGRARRSGEYLLMCLLQYREIRAEIEDKLNSDLQDFPRARQCIDGSVVELFQGDDELRAIWQSHQQDPHQDLVQWMASLPDVLQARVQHINTWVQLPKDYLVSNEALECVTILQREVAKQWNHRLTRQLGDLAGSDQQSDLLELTADVQQYLNRLMTPRRSSTYDDLHNRHQS